MLRETKEYRLSLRCTAFLVLALVTLVAASSRPEESSLQARRGDRETEIDWQALGDEAVDHLQRYLRFDTGNPPGAVIDAARFLADVLDDAGIDVRILESEPGVAANVYARIPATRAEVEGRGAGGATGAVVSPTAKPLMLLHHMDVVPADRERWSRDPFSGDIADGSLHGRGAMDMKGIGIAHLMTMLALARDPVPLDRDVVMLAVADEEVGGDRGMSWMVEHHPELVDVDFVLDEGGFGSYDVVADGRLVFNVSVAEKRILWIDLVAEGTAGHGSQPHDDNPNDRLIATLDRIRAMPAIGDEPPVVAEMRRRVGDLTSNKFVNAITHSTTSLTTLRSGVGEPPKVNVIPSIARATLDVRLLPGVSPETYLSGLRTAINDEGIAIEVKYDSGEPPVTSWETPLFSVIERVLARRHPGAVVTPSPIPYGSDANTLRQRGAGGYGFVPFIVPLDVVSSMHGDAERLPVEALREGIRTLHEIVIGYAGKR